MPPCFAIFSNASFKLLWFPIPVSPSSHSASSRIPSPVASFAFIAFAFGNFAEIFLNSKFLHVQPSQSSGLQKATATWVLDLFFPYFFL